jgi:hypothetical protein
LTNKSTLVGVILLLAIGFWAGSVWTEDNTNKGTVEISLDKYNFNGIENGKATFTKIDSTEQNNLIETATVGNLSSKALLISDLPNKSIECAQEGSMKYIVLKNGAVVSGYHDIRNENGLIVCQIGSMNYLLDKSGNPLPAPEEWIRENKAHFDQIINDIKNEKDKTEESKNESIAMFERDRNFPLGYHKIFFEGNRVYGQLGSQTAYIGDL